MCENMAMFVSEIWRITKNIKNRTNKDGYCKVGLSLLKDNIYCTIIYENNSEQLFMNAKTLIFIYCVSTQ